MRILFLTEQFPYPLDTGGNVRTFNILKGLATQHQVTLVATTPAALNDEALQEVGRLCSDLQVVSPRTNGLAVESFVFASCLLSRRSFLIARHASAAMKAELSRIRSAFDAVHFNHLDAAVYERLIPPGTPRVLDEHNVVANQIATTLKVERRVLRRLVLRREHRVLGRAEAQLCNRMALCLACSDTDERSLRALGVTVPITTVPNGVDLEYFTPNREVSRQLAVVFVGTLDYDPCERGVWFFLSEILPLLHLKYPDLKFVMVGRNPSGRLQRAASSDARIVITGRVHDIRPYVHGSRVFVVPLLSGSGTRLKILEALAMGTPTVTTRVGVEGIEAISNEHLLVADDPGEFAQAVCRLIEDGELAQRLAHQGRRLVEQQYGWPAVQQRLLQGYRELSSRPR